MSWPVLSAASYAEGKIVTPRAAMRLLGQQRREHVAIRASGQEFSTEFARNAPPAWTEAFRFTRILPEWIVGDEGVEIYLPLTVAFSWTAPLPYTSPPAIAGARMVQARPRVTIDGTDHIGTVVSWQGTATSPTGYSTRAKLAFGDCLLRLPPAVVPIGEEFEFAVDVQASLNIAIPIMLPFYIALHATVGFYRSHHGFIRAIPT